MKRRNYLRNTAIAGVLTALTVVPASADEISKPKGAMGSGAVAAGQAKPNQFWWPDQLDLSSLRDHDSRSNPLGSDFDYAEAFSKLDLEAAKKDIDAVPRNKA